MSTFRNRIFLTYRTVGTRFGAWISPLLSFGLFLLLRLIIWLGQRLDGVLYRSFREMEIVQPIVIVGNPRTGTTFLQRFLDETGFGVGQQVWQQLYPSLIIQWLFTPFLPILDKISPARHHSTVAHQTSLTSVETDDVSVFFRYFDGFFLYGFLLAHADEDVLDWFDVQYRDNSARDFAWLRKLWRRNLVARKHDRVVAKLFSVGANLKGFQEAFPDAKILYMARDPLEMIPSGISLITGVLEKRFQFSSIPLEDRQRYCQRMSTAFLELLRRFVEDWNTDQLNKSNIKIVPYTRLMGDFDRLMNEIADFVGHPLSEEQRQKIIEQAQVQSNYQSKHQYDLAQFFLDEDVIREDSLFFYDFLHEVE